MRVKTVKHAQKPGVCGKCGVKIQPSRDELATGKGGKVKRVRVLGDGYRWIKPRYGGRRVRCMAPGCAFRDSDMTSSEKLARVYDARDAVQAAVAEWDGDDVETLRSALEECAGEVREVAEEYGESADNIEASFSESATAEECREKADGLEGWADELEAADLSEWEPEEGEGDEEERNEDGQTKEEWADAQRETASEAASGCPV